MQNVLSYLLNFIFPLNCSFCGKSDFFASKLSICKKCIQAGARFSNLVISKCSVCNSNLILENCEYCTSRNVFFSKLYFIRTKGDLERKIIQKIKFGNSPHLSYYFRIGLKRHLPLLKSKSFSALVNIPSNKQTVRQRPIPVCKPIVNLLKNQVDLKVIDPFLKISNNLQSGKSFRDRFLHAQSAFMIKKSFENSLSGNYLLVDDVFTTGATINEIAKLLVLNGANEVDVLVLVKGKT